MTALDALFGRIFDDGVEIELRGGLNFAGFTIEPLNDAQGRPKAWTIVAPVGGGSSYAFARAFFVDPANTNPGRDGSAGNPYASIQEMVDGRPDNSDTTGLLVGDPTSYAEDVVLPSSTYNLTLRNMGTAYDSPVINSITALPGSHIELHDCSLIAANVGANCGVTMIGYCILADVVPTGGSSQAGGNLFVLGPANVRGLNVPAAFAAFTVASTYTNLVIYAQNAWMYGTGAWNFGALALYGCRMEPGGNVTLHDSFELDDCAAVASAFTVACTAGSADCYLKQFTTDGHPVTFTGSGGGQHLHVDATSNYTVKNHGVVSGFASKIIEGDTTP